MYLVLYLQVCFVLVSSNPLYEFDCCPNTYPSYRNDQPLMVQRSNYNPYPLNVLGHNPLNPLTNSQSVPHHCQYLNANSFLPNYQFYNQNGLDVIQHVPEIETQKVINNYILIPQEYFENDAFENNNDKKTREEVSKNNVIKNNKRNKNKRRKPNLSTNKNNSNADISKLETKTTKPERCKEAIDCTKSGRKKKKKSNKNSSNLLSVEETPPFEKKSDDGQVLLKDTNSHITSSCGKPNIEKNASPFINTNYQESKRTKESIKKELINKDIPDVSINPKKKDDTGFASINVSFDINEECTDLDCRHTRNKDVNRRNKPQSSKLQQDLPNNLNNYMNSMTYNQQMNPNFFNPNVNFPFNFDYLYQMPQTSTVKPKESNNRRRNRKRKQPASNRQTNSNKKNKSSISIVNNCDKVVELTPEVETTTVTTTTTTNTEEPQSVNVVPEEIIPEKDQDSKVKNPLPTFKEILHTEVLNNDEISNNENVPFDNYNDVMDEYYPDFTLDNTYMSSKEDYDFGNFHDRYYYAYGDKPELNRDRQKYEHPNNNNLDGCQKLNRKNQNKNIIQEPSQIQEIICKTVTANEKVAFVTPPVLEFPGFKTEMIDKEKYFAKEENDHPNINDISANKMCLSSKPTKGHQNQRNNVETVFANSKVVRYGAPEKEEKVVSNIFEPELTKKFENLISNDGKTTVVIAKSLDYSY